MVEGWVVRICVLRSWRRTYFVEHFLPDIIGPMWGNWSKEKSLKLNISCDEVFVHWDAGVQRAFSIEITS